ncbi:MAG TPA: hypothetical protein VNM37_01255, partial [Candidatus Dormibacteraeota bacterium]|nr:hypothetical protein [Candidatus Dormibacteraeota bacterium]
MKPGDPTSFAGPPSPEDMEWRITALLLGELSPEEAAALQETIAASPALAELHQRMQHTVGVVRDAVHAPETAPADAPSALKLSAERREKLLQAFKVIPPGRLEKERARRQPRRPVFSFREWGNVAAMAAALVLLAGGVMFLQSPSGQTTKLASYVNGDASDRGRKFSDWVESAQSGSGAKPAANAAPVVPPPPPVADSFGLAAADERFGKRLMTDVSRVKDEPAQTPTQLGRESAVVAGNNSALGLAGTPTENKEGKPLASSTSSLTPRQGPGQMLAWDTLSSDVDVKQKAEASFVQGAPADSASHRFYAGVTGGGVGGGGGGLGGGIVGGVPGGETKGQLAATTTKSEAEEKRANGLQEDKNRLSLKAAQDDLFAWTNSGAVVGATPPASGPAALATGGRTSGQLGNAAGKDLLGNESRFRVIQNEMLTEQAQAAPTVNAWALTPPPAAMPPPTPPVLQPPQQAPAGPATLSDFAKQQVSFGDTIADKNAGSRAAER